MPVRHSILLAEDEPQARESLRALLEDEGYRVVCAADGLEASEILAHSTLDAAILDLRMPGKDGLAVLRDLRDDPSPPAVLIMTAYGTSAAAIEAMALGAFDYVPKPVHFEELRIQLARAIDSRRRAEELQAYRDGKLGPIEAEMIGTSPPMQQLYKLIGKVAPTDSTVLIRGESGTGKELVARALHRHSRRASGRLVVVNSASIPESLLEAELFGYERGAFTGAAERRIGRLEFASGGTIFLDEIGELQPQTQAKLLRVLQSHEIERIGSNASVPLDVRILAATNRDLETSVAEGLFREDLYYRLNVVTLVIPPLRERREDIPELARYLLARCAERLRLPAPPLGDDALAHLSGRSWPGNVRELEHALERALILSREGAILPEHLDALAAAPSGDPFDAVPVSEGLHASVARLERCLIQRALAEAGGNRSRAAEILKINRRLLYDKMREHGVQ